MKYIFDSNSLIDLFKHYYLDQFPSLWKKFDKLENDGQIISVREVYNEIKTTGDRLSAWAKKNLFFFPKPSRAEMDFVKKIFQVADFQTMIKVQSTLQGKPVADPFVIAAANVRNAIVITEELLKPTGSKIPNVCKHFGLPCVNLQQFMKKENWIF